MASLRQIQIAKKLNIDVENYSDELAGAYIYDYVYEAIYPNREKFITSDEQIDFAEELGVVINTESSIIAYAEIAGKLKQKNIYAIKAFKLNIGDEVIVNDGRSYIISSIGKNHRLWFKGGNGKSAWPRDVVAKVGLI